MQFTHFHVHSQYSILDGAASIPGLIAKAKADGQTALALTDHGNMFGIKLFYDTCRQKGIKPILGCEAYVARVSLYNKEKPTLLDETLKLDYKVGSSSMFDGFLRRFLLPSPYR